MDCRIVKPVRFSREARSHAEIPITPVTERVTDMRFVYSQKNKKLILGQRHDGSEKKKGKSRGPGSKSPSRKSRSSRSRAGTRGSSRGASRGGNTAVNWGTWNDGDGAKEEKLDFDSVSLLSIGSIIDDFRSIMSVELNKEESMTKEKQVQASDLFNAPSVSDPESIAVSSVTSLSRPGTSAFQLSKPYESFHHVQLKCRFPACGKEFDNAFDLFHHTKSKHGNQTQRPFKESVMKARPHTTEGIDPRPRPQRLPDVPKNRPPSPDKTGIVWPVEVLQQQSKWQEGHQIELFAQHSAKLRSINAQLLADKKEKYSALNKSAKMLPSDLRNPSSPTMRVQL